MDQVVLIQSDTLGSPDQELGRILMGACLRLMGEKDQLPTHIVLINAGVMLATGGTATVEFLQKLADRGVRIISCRTCVDYFDIESKLAVGDIDGMANILDILGDASAKVLTLG